MNHQSSQMFDFDLASISNTDEILRSEIEFVANSSEKSRKLHREENVPPPLPQAQKVNDNPPKRVLRPILGRTLATMIQIGRLLIANAMRAGTRSFIIAASSIQFFFIYLVTFFVQNSYLGQLFWQRTFVTPAICFICLIALNSLLVRFIDLIRQESVIRRDLLPISVSAGISHENARQFIDHLNSERAYDKTLLKDRIRKSLVFLAGNQNERELSNYIESQSDRDFNEMQSGFASLNLTVWALPILGFIGTVLGISASVGGFSGAINTSTDIEAVKSSLNGVTSGLATSFDTTLLALIASLFVMFPKTMIKRRHELLLNNIDQYCEENLVDRVVRSPQIDSVNANSLLNAFDQILDKYQKTWEEKTGLLGERIASKLSGQFEKVFEQVSATFDEYRVESLSVSRKLQEQLADANKQNQLFATELEDVKKTVIGDFESVVHQVANSSESIASNMAQLSPYCEKSSKLLQEIVVHQRELFGSTENQLKELVEAATLSAEAVQKSDRAIIHSTQELPSEFVDQMQSLNSNSLMTVKFLSKINAKVKEQNLKLEQWNTSKANRKSWFQHLLGTNAETHSAPVGSAERFR